MHTISKPRATRKISPTFLKSISLFDDHYFKSNYLCEENEYYIKELTHGKLYVLSFNSSN
jgi:hypothetical protein